MEGNHSPAGNATALTEIACISSQTGIGFANSFRKMTHEASAEGPCIDKFEGQFF